MSISATVFDLSRKVGRGEGRYSPPPLSQARVKGCSMELTKIKLPGGIPCSAVGVKMSSLKLDGTAVNEDKPSRIT